MINITLEKWETDSQFNDEAILDNLVVIPDDVDSYVALSPEQNKNYNYNVESEYTFNNQKIAITLGKAKLILEDYPLQSFNQDFSSNIGFLYNISRSEFNGGILRQIDKRPLNSIGWLTYTNNLNWNYLDSGDRTPFSTVGSPAIVSNKLDVTGLIDRNVRYNNSNISSLGNTGCIKFKWTPNYSGSPTTNMNIIQLGYGVNAPNKILLLHSASGSTLRISVWDSSGNAVHVAQTLGTPFNPTALQTYIMEINFNASTGAIELYIDGVFKGSTPTTVFVRVGVPDLLVGSGDVYPFSNSFFEDVVLYTTVQHSGGTGGNHSAPYSLNEYRYLSDTITLPQFSYGGLGNIQSYDNFITTELNSPRYIINGYWFNGVSWVLSNGTYAESNLKSFVIANIGTAPISNNFYVNVVFNDSDIQMSIDTLSLEYTGQQYPIDNPSIESNISFTSDKLSQFIETITKSGSDEIKYIISVNGVYKWWNGLDWVNSNSSYAESNLASEITSNFLSLISTSSVIKYKALLHSDNGLSTPELDNVLIITQDIYLENGTYTSKLITRTGLNGILIQNININPIVPPNTSLTFYIKLETDGEWIPLTGNDINFNQLTQYFRWKAEFTSDGSDTPKIDHFILTYTDSVFSSGSIEFKSGLWTINKERVAYYAFGDKAKINLVDDFVLTDAILMLESELNTYQKGLANRVNKGDPTLVLALHYFSACLLVKSGVASHTSGEVSSESIDGMSISYSQKPQAQQIKRTIPNDWCSMGLDALKKYFIQQKGLFSKYGIRVSNPRDKLFHGTYDKYRKTNDWVN